MLQIGRAVCFNAKHIAVHTVICTMYRPKLLRAIYDVNGVVLSAQRLNAPIIAKTIDQQKRAHIGLCTTFGRV